MAGNPSKCDGSCKLLNVGTDVDGSGEQGTDKNVNIADLLPVDPFGMDIKSTITLMKGWFQDIEGDFSFNWDKYRIDNVESGAKYHGSYLGFDLNLNATVIMQPLNSSLNRIESSYRVDCVGEFETSPLRNSWVINPNYNVGNQTVLDGGETSQVGIAGDPHNGLGWALSYLEVEDLIAVEGVCKSMRDFVRGENLLWKKMKIKQPLSLKITDDALLKLTNRAQGYLESLILIDCIKISDDGLKQVLLTNPTLIKLSVPGCIRLTIDGILKNLRLLNSLGTLRIKHLRIGGLGCISKANFEELKSLVGIGTGVQVRSSKPHFFHLGPVYPAGDDSRPIDVEPCPMCGRIGLVYDCPAESCRGEGNEDEICRACTVCISRCIECGRCIRDRDYEETFLFDFMCLDCFEELVKRENRSIVKASSNGQSYYRREKMYQLRLCGN